MTYRDRGWQDPKFKESDVVQLIHQPGDTYNDYRKFVVVNYYRDFNGDFTYHIFAADGSNDEGEMLETEIEGTTI